jgi:hypothetical protein
MRIFKNTAICILILCIFISCSKEERLKKQFVKIVKSEMALINENHSKKKNNPECILDNYPISGTQYHAKYYEITGYDYNIIKTDSLVSPYIATVQFRGNYYEKEGNTEEKCLNQDWVIPKNKGVFIEYRYAYQDGEWALTKRLSNE